MRKRHLNHKMNTNVALNSKLDQIIYFYKKRSSQHRLYANKKGAQSQKVSDRTSIRLEIIKKIEYEIISFTI